MEVNRLKCPASLYWEYLSYRRADYVIFWRTKGGNPAVN